MKGVTLYSGVSKFYFRRLLRTIVKVGRLSRPDITILDFGCGMGELKKCLPGAKVIGFDIIPALSDISDWRSVDFDVLVANEVFYSFREEELDGLLVALKKKNPNMKLIVGISRQGLLNHVGKYLLGRPDAHSGSILGPLQELQVLERHCRVESQRNVMFLANVYALCFKSHSCPLVKI